MPQIIHERVKKELFITTFTFLAVNVALAISNGIVFLQNMEGMEDCPELTNYIRTVSLACTIIVILLVLAWRGYVTTFFIAVLCFCGVAYSVVVVSNAGSWYCPKHPPLRTMAMVDVSTHALAVSWFFVFRRHMGVAS